MQGLERLQLGFASVALAEEIQLQKNGQQQPALQTVHAENVLAPTPGKPSESLGRRPVARPCSRHMAVFFSCVSGKNCLTQGRPLI